MLQRICWSVRDGSRLRLVRKKRRMVRPQFRMDGRYSDVWLLVLSERSGPDQFQMRLVGDLVVTVGEEVPTTDLLSKRIGVREGKPGAEPERSRGKELHHDGTAWSFAPRHLSGRPTSPASVKFMRWRLASDCGRFVWLLPFLSPSPRAPGRRSCESALRIGEGSKRGDGKRVSGEARVGPPMGCGARFQSTTSNFAHLLCCTFKFEPGPSCTYPTRSEKAGSRKTTHRHLGRSSASPADDGGTVPANWQREKKRHFVSGHRLNLALRPPSSGDSTSRP